MDEDKKVEGNRVAACVGLSPRWSGGVEPSLPSVTALSPVNMLPLYSYTKLGNHTKEAHTPDSCFVGNPQEKS